MVHSTAGSVANLNIDSLMQNPFQTPVRSGRESTRAVSLIDSCIQRLPPKQNKFQSARLRGEYEKPWLEKRDIRVTYDKVIFWAFTFLGLCIGAYVCYDGWNSAGSQDYCLTFFDDFSGGISSANWNYEVQRGGFGSGTFDWTTTDSRNAYADATGLHIVPTLTTDVTNITDSQLLNGYTLNLTVDGTCTGTTANACGVRSNSTKGTVINPVRSARLNTKGKHNLLYGKVEVVAKLPKGDWLWPAIWMMPETDTYGEWPRSGEIDIMESRGNDRTYDGGRNAVSGTIHWGPNPALDQSWSTTGKRTLKRTDFSNDFHTFGVEWSPDYIFTYVDSLLVQSIYMPFGGKYGSLYDRANFGSMQFNNTVPDNPWAQSPNYNAPFDRPFYLILNVAVGCTNSYFPDGYAAKPWQDVADDAALHFWKARPAWEPTWGQGNARGMTIRSVKMFKPGKC